MFLISANFIILKRKRLKLAELKLNVNIMNKRKDLLVNFLVNFMFDINF